MLSLPTSLLFYLLLTPFIMLLFSQTKVIAFHHQLRISPIRSFARASVLNRVRSVFAWKAESGSTKAPGTMSNYKVIKYPDPRLRAENEVVTQFDENLQYITAVMLQLMYVEDGVGLAAPQLGINKRIMVFNEEGDFGRKDKEMILINPYIISKSTDTEVSEEGCLSFPLIRGIVSRHTWIEVEYQNVKGEKQSCRLEGFPAVIFQHEYDHLDKVLFIDRFNPQDKTKNGAKLDKLIRKYGPGGAV